MPTGVIPGVPRRRCDNCPKIYQPSQPMRINKRTGKLEYGFCCDNCRKDFHKHGGSYSKLKPVIQAEVRKAVKERNPLDPEWQRNIERQIAELQRIMHSFEEAFSFKRSA